MVQTGPNSEIQTSCQ